MLPFHILWLSLTNALGVMGVFHIAWFKLKEDAKPENVKEWQRLAQE